MELSRDDMMAAVSEGVRQAFATVLGDQLQVSFGHYVEKGVKEAFAEVLADAMLELSVESGVMEAFRQRAMAPRR